MVVVKEERRVSARIQEKQREEKLRLVKRRVEILSDGTGDENDKGDGAVDDKTKISIYACSVKRGRKVEDVEKVKEKEVEVEVEVEEQKEKEKEKDKEREKGKCSVETTPSGPEVLNGNLVNTVDKSDHAKVKDTVRLFNKYYLRAVKEEEQRCCRKVDVDGKASKKSNKSKPKKGAVREDEDKTKSKRPDLKAVSEMMKNNEILYSGKRIGDVPGVNVGHQFYSRAEMVVVGFHSHWLNGIDYMGMSYKGEYENYTFPLAVAIVLSGMYEDDLDNAEDVVYTGQGGHNLTGDKRQIRDQVLERGNLALKNCVDQGAPVRVIRGHESSSSYTRKVYTYDGLYKVVQYWAEKGLSGFTVFKFRLQRIEGQPILTTNQVRFINGRVPQSLSEIRGLVCEDISGGQEAFPIPATNLVDDPPVPPTGFTYCKSMQVAKSVKLPTSAIGCNCKGNCINSRDCSCAKLNSSDSEHYDFPYVHRDGGRLIEAKAVVFECGPKCGCGPDCINRTSQRGLKYRLEVYRTPKKGWAVRSWDFIPAGAPVCEYIGVLKRAEDLDNACDNENNFIFDIDCLQTMRGLGGRERRLGDVSMSTIYNSYKSDDQKVESGPDYCIDAGSSGNVSRFINHSCEPNIFVQCVSSSHHDLKLARVVLFAADNIPPLQELTYDYGYELDSVHGPDGKLKQMACFCGAEGCRGRLF